MGTIDAHQHRELGLQFSTSATFSKGIGIREGQRARWKGIILGGYWQPYRGCHMRPSTISAILDRCWRLMETGPLNYSKFEDAFGWCRDDVASVAHLSTDHHATITQNTQLQQLHTNPHALKQEFLQRARQFDRVARGSEGEEKGRRRRKKKRQLLRHQSHCKRPAKTEADRQLRERECGREERRHELRRHSRSRRRPEHTAMKQTPGRSARAKTAPASTAQESRR
eukprot:6465534-Amphidinium_carterae.1